MNIYDIINEIQRQSIENLSPIEIAELKRSLLLLNKYGFTVEKKI